MAKGFFDDTVKIRQVLSNVEIIDLVSFGSSVSPEYLLILMTHAFASHDTKKFGVIGMSLPGNGWSGGLNSLVHASRIDWIIGGFFATVRSAGLAIESGLLSAVNFPQGILAKLLTLDERVFQSRIGLETFIDPRRQSAVLGITEGRLQWLGDLVKVTPNISLEYRLPESQAVFLRGAGLTKNGEVIPETVPIDLDVKAIAASASRRGAKLVFQVPEGVTLPRTSEAIAPDQNVIIFEAPRALHSVCYFPTRYLSSDVSGLQGRKGAVVDGLVKQLNERVCKNERVIVGIGYPVACIQLLDPELNIELNIESGNIGGVPIDGSGFGYNFKSQKRISQLKMFERVWLGEIEHAILGIGDIDHDGGINVARLGDSINGVGGFVDISQSLRKITFCSPQKFRKNKIREWVCFSPNNKCDTQYIEI